MARWTGDPGISAVLEAADAWRSQCFLGSASALSAESLWTSDNLEALLTLFAGNPLTDKRDFLEKLDEQFTGAPSSLPKLAAEVLWFLNLLPSRSAMKPDTKCEQIERVWGWTGEPAPGSVYLDEAHMHARHTSYMERSVISVMRQLVADLEVQTSDLSGKAWR